VAPDYGKEFFLFVAGAQSSGVGGRLGGGRVLTQFIDTGPPEDPVLTPTGGKKKYSELGRIIGLDKPNRRSPSEQTEPPAPTDPVTGKRCRVGHFAPLGFYSKSLQRDHKKLTSLDVELCRIKPTEACVFAQHPRPNSRMSPASSFGPFGSAVTTARSG
jgi:hypothetical protein